MTETVLRCQNIEKRFFGVPVLQQVSFSLNAGCILGLVGENGAGKSTLMNILGGVFPPDRGEMVLNGLPYAPLNPADAFRSGIAFIHQELNLFGNLSIAENLFLHDFPRKRIFGIPSIDYHAIHSRSQELLEMVDLKSDPKTLLEELSPGERQLVEIAKALNMDAQLIIFDEPTTSLTTHEIRKLFDLIQRLRDQGISMIYISHTLEHVMSLCNQIMVLRDGGMVASGAREEFTIPRLISLMVGREIDNLFPPRMENRKDEVVLEVQSLSQPGIVHNISFSLHRGEILGVSGLMGSGRTELARILFGIDSFVSGHILLQGERITQHSIRHRIRRGLSFLTESRREEGLLMEAAIAENMALVSLPTYSKTPFKWIMEQKQLEDIHSAAAAVHLSYSSLVRQPVKTLSGGNQQKVVLAKWLLQHPLILILDEPTRGIDVGAKYEIYSIMNQHTASGGGVLFISSEIEELIGICDRILVMRKGEIQQTFDRTTFDREKILQAALGES
jgi:ribose transport system ATP-binding protein